MAEVRRERRAARPADQFDGDIPVAHLAGHLHHLCELFENFLDVMPRKKLAELVQTLRQAANRHAQIFDRLLVRTLGRMPYLESQLAKQSRSLRGGEPVHGLRHRRALAIINCRL